MKIKELHIENFKSLENVTLKDPNPLTVFAGPNGSGKSNLFEALEFFIEVDKESEIEKFGAKEDLFNKKSKNSFLNYSFKTNSNFELNVSYSYRDISDMNSVFERSPRYNHNYTSDQNPNNPYYNQFIDRFSRLFINTKSEQKPKYKTSKFLDFYASNLEMVLGRLLADISKKEEILELLQMFIPEFEDVRVETSKLSGDESLLIYEKGLDKAFPKHLVSDGTFNIIALIVAVLQYDEPQFLCIEEPENGLHPQVIKELVNFFREQCELKGHYIWLTTHSEALVSELKADEIVMVTKKNGATHLQQFKNRNFYSLTMDEAWKSNVLGGLPW